MPQTDPKTPEDHGEPPESAHTSQPSTPSSDLSKKSALIIGQATAAITIAAAVVYAAGGLALGLKSGTTSIHGSQCWGSYLEALFWSTR